MRVIDCCIFFNEVDLLKIRLSLLYDYADVFVICESNVTHSGAPKEFNFLKNKEQFEPWIDKIVFLKYEPNVAGLDFSKKKEGFDPESTAWQIENGQRNHLATYLLSQNDDDFAILCDVDEVWHPRLEQYLRSGELGLDRARLAMQFHYYYLNCAGIGSANSTWIMPYFSKIALIKKDPDLSRVRSEVKMDSVEKMGWHFSYIGGIEKIIQKLDAYAHQETNTEEIKNVNHLLRCINEGQDHLNREDHLWAFHPVDYYPPE